MSKNDMITPVSGLFETDLENIINTYNIPLDLLPHFPNPNLTMDRLPSDVIGDWFSFAKRRGIEDVCMDEGPSSMKKWKNKFFLIDRKAILDYLTWRHSYSCVFYDLPIDGYDQNHVEQLCVHFIKLCEINEVVLVRSGLSDANVVEEPHHFPTLILERVHNNTIAPTAEGTLILLPTLDEVAAAQPSPKKRLRKKSSEARSSVSVLEQTKDVEDTDISDFHADLENKLEGNEGTSLRAASAPSLRHGKRLGSPPFLPYVTTSDPSHVGTSGAACASTSGLGLVQKGAVVIGSSRKAGAESLLDQKNRELRSFSDALSNELRKLKVQFAEAEATAARLSNELVRTNSKLSDKALIVRDFQNDLALEKSKSQKYRDVVVDAKDRLSSLRGEVTDFVGSGVESLFHSLLFSDEFNSSLACIAYLGITSGVERGLRMGRTDVGFEEAAQNVSNFFVGTEAEFNKAVADLPSIKFLFLAKIAEASEGALSEIANIQPNKLPSPTAPASASATNSTVAKTFGWTSAQEGSELPRLGPDVSSS
ncbi:hypothetical protein Tco_0461920 [Tanacetum coccineum]